MLKIHILFEHSTDLRPHGCAFIRDILPFDHLADHKDFAVTIGTEYLKSDVLVVERLWKPDLTVKQAEQVVEQIHIDEACLIYSIDDNLLELDHLSENTKMAIRFFCREANGVIVSTTYLKDRLERLNKNIYVIPNALDERLFGDFPQKSEVHAKQGGIKIGYMGTFTHDADLLMVLQPLRKLLRKYPETLEFQIVGGVSNPSLFEGFQDLPLRIFRLEPEDVAYPQFISWMKKNAHWDIGIAPLEDNLFNKSKSDIKFLDYSGLGIPGIYSNVPSYNQTINHLQTGYLSNNTPAEWFEALEFLVKNENIRLQIAKNAYDYVFSTRILRNRAVLWKEAVFSIVNNL